MRCFRSEGTEGKSVEYVVEFRLQKCLSWCAPNQLHPDCLDRVHAVSDGLRRITRTIFDWLSVTRRDPDPNRESDRLLAKERGPPRGIGEQWTFSSPQPSSEPFVDIAAVSNGKDHNGVFVCLDRIADAPVANTNPPDLARTFQLSGTRWVRVFR